MIKHVCIRTDAKSGNQDWYVAHTDQPEGGRIELGSFFDNLKDAQDLQKRAAKRWPNETFEVFTLVKR